MVFPGYKELVSHFSQHKNPSFEMFILENSENIAVWSANANTRSACNLYSLWKKRFVTYWNQHHKSRLPRITFDHQLWELWHAQATEIKFCSEAYKLQGLQVLKKSSSVVAKQVVRSLGINNGISSFHEAADAHCSNNESQDALSSSGDTATSSIAEAVPEIEGRCAADTTAASLKFKIPSIEHRYILNGIDVSMLFYAFQVVVANSQQKLHMEDNVHHILSMSSILLLQKDRFHPDLVSIFGRQLLNDIVNDMHKTLNVGAYGKDISTEAIQNASKAVKDVKFERASRLDAMMQIYNLCKTAPPNTVKILKSVAKLIEKLPNQAIMENIKETEHCQRFVDPILSGLFDDPEHGVLFRWTSVLNDECKQNASISSTRPDSVVTSMNGLFFGFSLGFAEIKPTTIGSKYLASKDLVRLGVLSKNSIDQHDLRACLTIQVAGFQMTVFLTTLHADGLYLMVELGTIKIPASIQELPQFLASSDEIGSILDCFQSWCSSSPHAQSSFKRKSLHDERFTSLVETSRYTKRRSYTSL